MNWLYESVSDGLDIGRLKLFGRSGDGRRNALGALLRPHAARLEREAREAISVQMSGFRLKPLSEA